MVMGNKKWLLKLIGLFLVLNIIAINNISAISDEHVYAGNQLKILGILKGYEDGSLRLENNITRAEVATMTVRILGYEDMFIVGEEKNFNDVNMQSWAYPYIQNAYKIGVVKGYPDNSFKPNNNITYAEVIAIMVAALNEEQTIEGEWPYNYINKAIELNIITENEIVEPNKIITRGEMSKIVWHTLLVKQ